MRYVVREGKKPDAIYWSTSHGMCVANLKDATRFDASTEATKCARDLNAYWSPRSSFRVVPVLGTADLVARARAATWLEAADRLEDAVDGLRADGHGVAADWVAEHVAAYRRTAEELWPAGAKGKRGERG